MKSTVKFHEPLNRGRQTISETSRKNFANQNPNKFQIFQ
jgi:hypothetical protein